MTLASHKRILILGADGMLGSGLFRILGSNSSNHVVGVVRSNVHAKKLSSINNGRILILEDYILDTSRLSELIQRMRPHYVINSVGLIKHKALPHEVPSYFLVNSVFPHKLENLCSIHGVKLIHFSTDCIFSGSQGGYTEQNIPDPQDNYGLSKLYGEVCGPNTITLRTSIVGHELGQPKSLVDWFLASTGTISGYKYAIFSGLPVVEVAAVLENYVMNDKGLNGLYHLSAQPISKLDLLKLIKNIYDLHIEIEEDTKISIDRSLDSSLFQNETGYIPPMWSDLVINMKEYWQTYKNAEELT